VCSLYVLYDVNTSMVSMFSIEYGLYVLYRVWSLCSLRCESMMKNIEPRNEYVLYDVNRPLTLTVTLAR